jgi:hypothetical protein
MDTRGIGLLAEESGTHTVLTTHNNHCKALQSSIGSVAYVQAHKTLVGRLQ